MTKDKRYTIASVGGKSPYFFNGYFVDEGIPGIVGKDEFFAFFDERLKDVVYINKANVIWISDVGCKL